MDGILVRSGEPEQKFQEIKKAVIFSRGAEVRDGRKELLDKNYAGTAGDVQAFQTRLEDACAARGVFGAEEIVVHGDGGEFIKTVTGSGQLGWIARFGEKAKQTLIRILDPYHLLEKFKRRFPQTVAVKAQAQQRISIVSSRFGKPKMPAVWPTSCKRSKLYSPSAPPPRKRSASCWATWSGSATGSYPIKNIARPGIWPVGALF